MVQKLRKTGMPQPKVCELTGISERSIRRIEQEPEVTDIDETNSPKSRQPGRPSSVSPYEAEIRQWFDEPRNPEDGPLKSREVLARLRNRVAGGVSPPAPTPPGVRVRTGRFSPKEQT